MVFNYIENGIKKTIPNKQISLSNLEGIIKNNPKKSFIEYIIDLKRSGDKSFRDEKKKLPNILPNCIVKKRNLEGENFELNFISSTGYIYIDIDYKGNDIQGFKEYFINRYGHLVTMVSLSSTHGGLAILFRITNKIQSQDDFYQIWSNLKDTILKDESIDEDCKDIGRAMFIPYDPNVFINYSNTITVELVREYVKETKVKSMSQCISKRGSKYILSHTIYKLYDITTILKVLKLKTPVICNNPVVDVYPIDYTIVTFHKNIQDGNKRKMYNVIIHGLVYLNPDIEPDYIFSYLNYINNKYATPSMEFNELVYLFNSVYTNIKNNESYNYRGVRIKWVHYNTNSGLLPNEKRYLACKINGMRRGNDSIKKILDAKEYLKLQGIKVTQKKLMEITGLGIATIKKHYRKEGVFDIDQFVNQINCSEINELLNLHPFKGGGKENESVFPNVDEVSPDCPKWVKDYYNPIKMRRGFK